MNRYRRSLAFAFLLIAACIFLSAHIWAASPTIVISQVYGGGGNAGATYTHDFVELFNRGTVPVNLTGWSVQYASAASTTWQRTDLSGTLAPGQYFLVQEAVGAGGTTPLPIVDASGSIAMSATSGKVALVSSVTNLSGSCPTGAWVDLVGYGTANCAEDAATPALTNTTADLRTSGGCVDTDSNRNDFATGAPLPRNSASALNVCSGGDGAPAVQSTAPVNNAVKVAIDAPVSITFTEPVFASGGWYSIDCTTSGNHLATETGGPQTFTLDPAVDFAYGETCTVSVLAAAINDQDGNDPPDTPAADYSFSFTTVGPPAAPARIHEIQGAAHLSPKNGMAVSNVPGIVTAKAGNGFYMQDPQPDADLATSEGVFVFTSSAPAVAVGDDVRVTGTVSEFRPGGSATNLTTTEIVAPEITVMSSGNLLPAPTVIGVAGRVPPDQVIEDDSAGDVETASVFDPALDGIDFYESLEGMRVEVDDAVAVGPRNAFGEIPVAGDGGATASVRTGRGGVVIQANDFNPERVFLDDVLAVTPPANVGDRFPGAVVGVMDYSFGNFKMLVTSTPTVVLGGLAQESLAPAGAGRLAIATFNVENLDPNDPPTKFAQLAHLITDNLASPDLIALEEMQDNNGATNNGNVDASATFAALISAVQAAGGPLYSYRQIDPVDGQDGGEPGGNIRVGFLFRTDRGLAFVDRPGGDSLTPVTVVSGSDGPQLSVSPGRIEPGNAAFTTSRKPLAGEFKFAGEKLFAIANHFNSKGGDQPLFGRFQPPVRSSETQRHQQADIVRAFTRSILDLDANARVVVLGDFNDFEFSDTVGILKSAGLHDMIETLPPSERYSYVFEGNSQSLDHVLVSDALFAKPFVHDVVHVNSEFAVQASDHDPQVTQILFVPPTPTATATPTATPTPTVTPTPTATNTPTPTSTATNAPISLSIADTQVVEGNSGTNVMSFKVTLSRASAQWVAVLFITSNGTAVAPIDYIPAAGALLFAPGQITQTIQVPVRGDRLREPNETLFVHLGGAIGARLARSQATGTIINND